MFTERNIFALIVALFSIGSFYGCNTYRKSLPSSFQAVMEDPKLAEGKIFLFRFYLCDHDTFHLSMNGVQIYTNYSPSKFSQYTWVDEHTSSSDTIYFYDFVVYQYSRNRAFLYFFNDSDNLITIPLQRQSIEISGRYSITDFNYTVPMGSCKQFILHHDHKEGVIVRDEALQRIRMYE